MEMIKIVGGGKNRELSCFPMSSGNQGSSSVFCRPMEEVLGQRAAAWLAKVP